MILMNSKEQRLLTRAVCIGALSLASIGSLIGCGFALLDTTPPDLVTISNVTSASESASFELVNPNNEAIRVRIALTSSSSSSLDAVNIAIDDGMPEKFTRINIRLMSRSTDREPKRIQITGLTNGETYTVTLTTTDSSGNLQQATITATPLAPPDAPTDLAVVPGDSSAALTWRAPTGNTEVEVTGYRIYRRDNTADSQFTLLATDPKTLPPDSLTYTDASVANGTAYRYHIRAVNANGTESVGSNTGPSLFHLHANGVTILCPFAEDGAAEMINGDLYTKRTKMEIDNLVMGDDAAMENAARSCTSGIKDMSFLFSDTRFNKDISHWDTSSVTNMIGMFLDADAFDRDIGRWNVAAVQHMTHMFNGARMFDKDIGDWKVDAVTNMGSMFLGAAMFNQDIGDWKVGAVTDMSSMFKNAAAFNRDIGGWDVSGVSERKKMADMFKGVSGSGTIFNHDLSRWCVSSIASKPDGFNEFSALTEAHLPRWGSCPS